MGGSSSKKSNANEIPKPTKEDKKLTESINKQIDEREKLDYKFIKMLFLGAGESGKSTIIKQFVRMYGEEGKQLKNPEELRKFREPVFRNVLQAIHLLSSASRTLEEADESSVAGRQPLSTAVGTELASLRDKFADLQTFDPYARRFSLAGKDLASMVEDFKKEGSELPKQIETLWADQGIKNAWERRAEFQVFDSAAYFLDKVLKIAEPDYTPTWDDCLRVRERTTAVNSIDVKVKHAQRPLRIVDVGGQRNEREKWIHHFDNVRALIFVVAASAYDLKVAEDNSTPRLDEALRLFDDTVNNKYFKDKDVILYLNKIDLFKEKIKKVPISVFFRDIEPSIARDKDKALDFIANKFKERMHGDRGFHLFKTCATDTNLMEKTIKLATKLVLDDVLREFGFI